MGNKGSSQTTLGTDTHVLQQKPTGTLIYAAKSEEQIKSKSMLYGPNVAVEGNIDFKDLQVDQVIGEGSYGKVSKGRYKDKRVAIKQVYMPNDPSERFDVLEDFDKESKILKVLRHPNIVLFFGAGHEEPDNYFLVFELMAGSVGTLLKMVEEGESKVTWEICNLICQDAATACKHLHNLDPQIIHRDLKAENLLLSSDFRCKLTDFGLSRTYDSKGEYTVCGTPCWVAPEIFRGEAYTEKIDVYSFGIVIWELFCFKKPYMDEDGAELPFRVAKRGLRPPYPKHVHPLINTLMKKCWYDDATKRPSFDEVLQMLEDIEDEMSSMLKDPVDIDQPWDGGKGQAKSKACQII